MMMRAWLKYLVVAFAIFSYSLVFAQEVQEVEDRKARLEKEIAIIDKQLIDNKAMGRSQLTQLNLIRSKASYRRKLLSESSLRIRRYSDQIYSAQKQINRLNEQKDTLEKHYVELVRCAYKNRDTKIWFMYIIASENLGQALRRFGYFRDLSRQMDVQAKKIIDTKQEIAQKKTSLEALRLSAQKEKSQRSKELENLKSDEHQTTSVISELNKNKKKYEKELLTKRKEMEALDREIKRLIEEAMAAENGSNTTGKGDKVAAVIDYKLSGEFAANKGKLPWPVRGSVVYKYGQQKADIRGIIPRFSHGINILTPGVTDVISVFDGVVKGIIVQPGYNQCVLVQHGLYFTLYGKLKSTTVKTGDKVKVGQVLGQVDEINGETQLHFQIWKNYTTSQDPELWLK